MGKRFKSFRKRLATFTRIRLAILEYKAAKIIWARKSANVEALKDILEERIESAKEREREARELLKDYKVWAEQLMLSFNRLHYFEGRLDNIQKGLVAQTKALQHERRTLQ